MVWAQERLDIEIKIQIDVSKDDTLVNVQILIPFSSLPPTQIRFYGYYLPHALTLSTHITCITSFLVKATIIFHHN